MNAKEMNRWLDRLPVLAEVPHDSEAKAALEESLGGKGLTVLLGLVLGSRQALYAHLSRRPLGTPEEDCRAAVIQGKIQGLELVVETVRQLAIPEEGPNGGAEQ